MSAVRLCTATLTDIPAIQQVVKPAWRAVYGPILSAEQVEYMLTEFYNTAALTELISSNEQEFVLLWEDDELLGFAAFSTRKEDPTVFKLNKLYLLPEVKGRGYGKLLLDEVERRVAALGVNVLELNVNKYNSAVGFYEKMGFKVIYEEDIPVGAFFMNDFVMQKTW